MVITIPEKVYFIAQKKMKENGTDLFMNEERESDWNTNAQVVRPSAKSTIK